MSPNFPPEVPPGMPDGVYNSAVVLTEVEATLASCGEVVDRYVGQLSEIVNECLRSCGSVWATCESCVTGKIGERFAKAGAISTKCVGKLIDKALVLFNQAEGLASPVIGNIPELRDVVAAQMVGYSPGARLPIVPPASGGGLPGDCFGPNGEPIPCPPPPVPPPPGPAPGPGPGPGPGGSISCPPGTWAVFDEAAGQWYCKPLQPPPPPKPGPTCEVVPPPCPPGMEAWINPVTNAWECKEVEAPCPPPTESCPPGSEWAWDGTKYYCKPKPSPGPSPGPGPWEACAEPKPKPELKDLFGFTAWNRLFCPDTNLGTDQPTLDEMVQRFKDWVDKYAGALWSELPCDDESTFNKLVRYAASIPFGFVQSNIRWWGETIIRWLGKERDCQYPLMLGPILMRAVVSFVEHWFDVGLDDLVTNLGYSINRACPTYLPSQPGTDAAFLRNEIDEETWKCWTRAVNNLDVPAKAIVHAQRTQPNHEQWTALYMRGVLTHEQWLEKMRGVGVLDESDRAMIRNLMDYIPGPSDLIRFMLRDVEDKEIVQKYELDAEFEAKYQGLLKQFSDAQGIDEQTMRRYWRAHWDWPSPTQLYTMLHRLRDDSINNEDRQIAVHLEDILQVLGVKDVIPIWRERLVAISYRLPRKTDAYKLFKENQWAKDDVVDYYQNYGYPLKTAQRMYEIDARRKRLEFEKAARLLSKANVSKALVDGAIDQPTARAGFEAAGLEGEQINIAMEHALYLRTIAQRKRVKSAIKCQFVACGLTKDSAVAALIVAGWDAADAAYEVACWKQQCEAKGKEATTAMLCDWYGLGLLTIHEYRTRLRRMGWSSDDADRIIGQCEDDIRKKKEKSNKGGSSNGNGKPK